MTQPAKHTPGPWTARKAPERNAYAWDVEGAQGTVPTIARMALVDRVSEVEGNAYLIAAAPAMYEALLAVLDSENSTLGDGGSILGDDYRSLLQTALAQVEGR